MKLREDVDGTYRGLGIVLVALGLVAIAMTFGLINNLVAIPIIIGTGCIVKGYEMKVDRVREEYKELEKILGDVDPDNIVKMMEEAKSLII